MFFLKNLLFLFKYSINIPEIIGFWYVEKLKDKNIPEIIGFWYVEKLKDKNIPKI